MDVFVGILTVFGEALPFRGRIRTNLWSTECTDESRESGKEGCIPGQP